MQKKKTPSVRLSRHIHPKKYQIEIFPDLESSSFEGKEIITLQILKPGKEITLHSRELEITSADLEKSGNETWAGKVTYNKKNETATLIFPKNLSTGSAKLHISFRGLLNDQMRGYYKSQYELNGEKKIISATQFEATDARMAFPCFDEPNMKAVFELSLRIPTGHEAVSNTLPVSIEEHSSGFKTVKFMPTPKMSTYLLAFITGELDYLESKTKNRKVTVRVYTPKNKKQQGKFALEVAVKTLEFFESYFRIPYPLPTLDLIALPDFASGAMENWGAVTFRESALLIDESQSSLSKKQWVALVIGHELAHQWFGNLVTMDWWTHLWLNEGFASYIEYLAVDHIFPKWQIWNQFLMMDLERGINKDGLSSTHEIEVDVHDPNEIDEIFDDISYRKGSSIIRMLVSYIGERAFREGLHLYLDKHKYKNASTEDLWKALEKASGKPVGSIMQKWTKQPGLPLVSVTPTETGYTATQQRYFRNPSAKIPASELWPIPLRYGTKAKEQILLENKTGEIVLSEKEKKVVKFNLKESSFIRTNYREEHWKYLATKAKEGEMDPEDRFGLASNFWAMAEAGFLPTSTALDLSLYFRKETDFTTLYQVLSGALHAKSLFAEDVKIKRGFENYLQLLLEPTKKRLGFETTKTDSHSDQLLRPMMFRILGKNNDLSVQEKALQLLTKSIRETPVPTHLRGAVYEVVASLGERPEFNYFKQHYSDSDNAEEREKTMIALVNFTQPKIIEDSLKFSLTENVRNQDKVLFNRHLSNTGLHSKILWEFTRKHWKNYRQLYGHGGRMLNLVITSLASCSQEDMYKEIKKFLSKQTQPGLARTISQTLEAIDIKIRWKNRDQEDVKTFLQKYL